MKNLSLFILTTSTLLNACSTDSDATPPAALMPDSGSSSVDEMTTEGEQPVMDAASTVEDTTEGGTTRDAAGYMTSDVMSMPDAHVWDAGVTDDASMSKMFTVTIKNVAPVKLFGSAGVFDTPLNDVSPGAATPGKKYQFSINAGRKQKLSFVTMLAATNDLFFGPNGDGIALYDDVGQPISGDVTDQIYLWDAGTEVNEEPRVGPNTVSKQAGPNTGTAENGNVAKIADTSDPFEYPSVADVMAVSVAHVGGTEFLVTIENVSTDMALQTSEGNFGAPLSPGVWVVHNQSDPLFTEGMPDRGQGIEHIAEDGNTEMSAGFLRDNEGVTYPASPGVWAVHRHGDAPLYTQGATDYGDGLEDIAEDGNPGRLGAHAMASTGITASAIFDTPVDSDDPGPIVPGLEYQFSFEATPGDALSFVSMLAATNDAFFGPADMGIALFDSEGHPLTGDITSHVYLWDAGTEGNEQPGVGPHTVTNQVAANTGTAGEGAVDLLDNVDDFSYPEVGSVLKVSIRAE